MHASLRFASLVGTGGLAALIVAACSTAKVPFDDTPPSITGQPEAGPPDGPGCTFRCSRDLKKVVQSCAGVDTETACPPDQGCGIDKCVDACQSAELSKGSAGCSFWTLPADDAIESAGACFAAMIANTWDRPVTITAELGNTALDISKSIYTAERSDGAPVYKALTGPLPPGEVALVFLAQAGVATNEFMTLCPDTVKPAFTGDPLRHGTTKTRAFHLKTDAPVSAYSIFPYGGAESYFPTATLLLPVSSWEKGYIAVSTGKFGDPERAKEDRRTIQIIANEDDTQVSMRPTIGINEGAGVAPVGAGEVQTWSLSRGEVLQITQSGATTGSPISSNKPVGLFGGAPCNFLPSAAAQGWCVTSPSNRSLRSRSGAPNTRSCRSSLASRA